MQIMVTYRKKKKHSAEINKTDQILREIISSSSGCDNVKKSESNNRGNNNKLNSDYNVIDPVDSTSVIPQKTTNTGKSKNVSCCDSGNKTEKMNKNSIPHGRNEKEPGVDGNIEETMSSKNEYSKGKSKLKAITMERLGDKYGIDHPHLSTNLSSDFTSDSSSGVASVSSADSLSDYSHSILSSDVSESDDDASYYLDDEPITVRRIFDSVVALFTDSPTNRSNEVRTCNDQSKEIEEKLKIKSIDNNSRINQKSCESTESVGKNFSFDMTTKQDEGKYTIKINNHFILCKQHRPHRSHIFFN